MRKIVRRRFEGGGTTEITTGLVKKIEDSKDKDISYLLIRGERGLEYVEFPRKFSKQESDAITGSRVEYSKTSIPVISINAFDTGVQLDFKLKFLNGPNKDLIWKVEGKEVKKVRRKQPRYLEPPSLIDQLKDVGKELLDMYKFLRNKKS
ncbi:hypothetical protein HYX19_02760 [Candidatus Woesearchaeota archaeon]|nr:hypothetical protein [Candidatus Woesearchaeota archaeon]